MTASATGHAVPPTLVFCSHRSPRRRQDPARSRTSNPARPTVRPRLSSESPPSGRASNAHELAEAGDEVALVLAASASRARATLLEHVRRLHPHAKRALLVPTGRLDGRADRRTRSATPWPSAASTTTCRGRRPPDEVFHEAVSGFLLDWATDRRLVPQTVQSSARRGPAGPTSCGRCSRCAAPHAFCLADSERGRELLAEAGPEARLPLMVLPDGTPSSDPSNAEIAAAAGPRRAGGAHVRRRHRRRGARRPLGGRLRRLRRDCACSSWTRAASAGRPGRAR